MSDTIKDEFATRIQTHFKTQPASCCFLLAVLSIAITMAALGLYVRRNEELPDLDSMKVISRFLTAVLMYIVFLELERIYRKIECE